MSWIPLAERFADLPLILSGPLLRRVEPQSVTVWLALKEARKVTLRIYSSNSEEQLLEQCEGTEHTMRLGDHLHLIAVTARTTSDQVLAWDERYYYDLFFQADDLALDTAVPEDAAHLDTPGILTLDPSDANPLHRLVYPGHPLPSFVLPPTDVNRLRIMHGSCRKPHGIGKEMLSALDSILETSMQQDKQRPQQLFLTGDQIYADDVAAPLLFALMDAGNFLFAGNQEEMLPVVHAPAHALAPGGRSDTVRNKALLTSTTPQNHLLALSEYAAMYLFAWSDVLWPHGLPGAQDIWHVYPEMRPQASEQEKVEEQYKATVERLQAFRSGLPHVRRALANIATYMICDDHEVTDDWFLDGAWCRQVLGNPLGRRVLRNALLTYALFQGWGNTPDQFAAPNGQALLDAVDSWRGHETVAWSELVEETLGLPPAFSGSGELSYSARTLHWHYTYCGPRYEVIVMDTRTRRLYCSPSEFPGLLSPAAIHTQIIACRSEEAEVTIIVSATPVLGIDFVESIQFWSRLRIRDNYAYDREAWSLEWGTFQHFLKTVSAMQRVVFLSGDVHYAFGSTLEYWDQHTNTTARIVDFTSSPFCNEDAGSHIAVLAVGYPRLRHLLRHRGTATLDFFAWDLATNDSHILKALLKLIRKRIYLFWWSIPRLLAAHRSPYEIVLPAHGWLKDAFHGFPPDRTYRLHYLPNTLAHTPPRKRYTFFRRFSSGMIRLLRPFLEGVTVLEKGVGKTRSGLQRQANKASQRTSRPARALTRRALRSTDVVERGLEKRRSKLVNAILHYATWLNRWKAGELVIGYNNIGDISFQWNEQKKGVTQRLWWRLDDPTRPLLHTEYRETLDPPALDAAPPLP